MQKKVAFILIFSFFILNSQFFIFNSSAGIRWQANGIALNTIDTQGGAAMLSDGAGGSIFAWNTSDGNNDVYAQYVNASGTVQWTAGGKAVCTYGTSNSIYSILNDGSTGAILIWNYASNDIYAQRINSSGDTQWGASSTQGKAVCNEATASQTDFKAITDGSGGAIVVFRSGASGSYNIHAQRIDSSGTTQWGASDTLGKDICTLAGDQQSPQIISDGSGGAIITWQHGASGSYDVYARRIDSSGNIVSGWGVSTDIGIAICTAANNQAAPKIVSDGVGGAIITWQDKRSDANGDIYAVRIDSSGSVVSGWTSDGTLICNASGTGTTQNNPVITTDGSSGAIISWQDNRDNTTNSNDIYVQRINSSGTVQWTANGVVIANTAGNDRNPSISADGLGGAFLGWWPTDPWWQPYVQRINSSGVVQWTAGGINLDSGADTTSTSVISDGLNGVIASWRGYSSVYEVKVQRISNDAPTVTSITPSNENNSGLVNITNLAGTLFYTNATVKLTKAGESDIPATNVIIVSSTQITCTFDITNKTAGNWNIVISNIDGQSGALSNGFEIKSAYASQTITSITPFLGSSSTGTVSITDLKGTGFVSGITSVKLTKDGESSITATDVSIVSSTKITCKFDLTDKAVGKWNVVITNADGTTTTLANGFEIKREIVDEINCKELKDISFKGPKGQIRLEIPANTFNKDTTLNINPDVSLPVGFQSSKEYKATGIGVEIKTNESNLKQQKSTTLTLGYKAVDIVGMNESKLVITVYNTKANRWDVLPSKVYPTERKVVATLPHFSLYQIMEYFRQMELTKVEVYPNPFTPKARDSRFNQVTFKFENTEFEEVDIKIWDITGRQVRSMRESGLSIVIWDGKDEWGNIVEAGIYVYQIKVGSGVAKKGTLVCAK
jgi:hypothetical protein